MSVDENQSEEALLQSIVGEDLIAVEFVQDYVQLKFDSGGITAISDPRMMVAGRSFEWGDPGFRDELCARIAGKVMAARIDANRAVVIDFEDGARVEIPLTHEYGPEAVQFSSTDQSRWWVL